MAWEYKITRSSLGYKIYRKREENGIMNMEWLQNNSYTLSIEHARTFYTINDAMSALVIAKTKGDKRVLSGNQENEKPRKQRMSTTSIRKSESEERREKKSWGEL